MSDGGIQNPDQLVNLFFSRSGGIGPVASALHDLCAFGSSATTAASAALVQREENGYEDYFTGATVAAAGRGPSHPPAFHGHLHSVLAVPVSRLFLTGVGPGILCCP